MFRFEPERISGHIEDLLAADNFKVQNQQQVFEAAFVLKRGLGEFEDVLIGALDAWAGCVESITFDRGASRLPHFRVISPK